MLDSSVIHVPSCVKSGSERVRYLCPSSVPVSFDLPCLIHQDRRGGYGFGLTDSSTSRGYGGYGGYSSSSISSPSEAALCTSRTSRPQSAHLPVEQQPQQPEPKTSPKRVWQYTLRSEARQAAAGVRPGNHRGSTKLESQWVGSGDPKSATDHTSTSSCTSPRVIATATTTDTLQALLPASHDDAAAVKLPTFTLPMSVLLLRQTSLADTARRRRERGFKLQCGTISLE